MRHTPKDRLIAAALRVAAAERGGLDSADHDEEIDRAHAILDDAIDRYVAARDA